MSAVASAVVERCQRLQTKQRELKRKSEQVYAVRRIRSAEVQAEMREEGITPLTSMQTPVFQQLVRTLKTEIENDARRQQQLDDLVKQKFATRDTEGEGVVTVEAFRVLYEEIERQVGTHGNQKLLMETCAAHKDGTLNLENVSPLLRSLLESTVPRDANALEPKLQLALETCAEALCSLWPELGGTSGDGQQDLATMAQNAAKSASGPIIGLLPALHKQLLGLLALLPSMVKPDAAGLVLHSHLRRQLTGAALEHLMGIVARTHFCFRSLPSEGPWPLVSAILGRAAIILADSKAKRSQVFVEAADVLQDRILEVLQYIAVMKLCLPS